jgi:hypothetical protein
MVERERSSMSQKGNIKFLRTYLEKLQKLYIDQREQCPQDLIEPSPKKADAWNKEAERVALLADANDFDGSMYRDYLFPSDNPLSLQALRRLHKQIETIPRIIAEIEKHVVSSKIPDKAVLPIVTQVTQIADTRPITLKLFMLTYCELPKGADLKSKTELLFKRHKENKITLPNLAMEYRRGRPNYYLIDDLKRNWNSYTKIIPTLFVLKLPTSAG